MAVVIVVGLILSTLLMAWWLWENSADRRALKAIPCPPRLPLIGNVHLLKSGQHEVYQQILGFCRHYGDLHGLMCLWVGPNPIVLLTKPHTIEPLLSSSTHISKAKEYNFVKPWLGTGLLTSAGEKWRSRRKLLTPTFHFRILEDFLNVFNEQSRILVRRLDQKVGEKEPFDIFPYFTLCTLDVICESAMGKHTCAQTEANSEYAEAVKRISQVLQKRFVSPWLYPDIIFNNTSFGKAHQKCLDILHGFTRQVIQERSAELDKQLESQTGKIKMEDLQTDKPFLIGKQKRLAFLDMLLIAAKGGADLSFSDIQEEVDTFMFEGHDTTASTSTWTVYLLGRHPEIHERVHKELDDIFGDSDRDATPSDIRDMAYLECVIKESMRVLPAVPWFARIIEEDCDIGGFRLPTGTTVNMVSAVIHKDPVFYPDPERFDPDRWLPENSEGRHPYCYVPFSAGFRNCIGQKFAMHETKTILSSILRAFFVKSHQSMDEIRPLGDLITKPERGLLVSLIRRR